MTDNDGQGNRDGNTAAVRVLLADDHAVVRDGLRLVLDGETDITVVGEASEGRETVAETRRLEPDVAVLDIAMPGLNGIEATRRIREFCPAVKVVILSMHATAEHIYQALDAGAHGYVLKESAGTEVVESIRAVLADRRYLSKRISDTIVDEYLRQRHPSTPGGPLASLTRREREVLQLVVEGKSSKEIAAIVHLSPKTVETYRSRMMQKLGVRDIPTLVKFAITHGLTDGQ